MCLLTAIVASYAVGWAWLQGEEAPPPPRPILKHLTSTIKRVTQKTWQWALYTVIYQPLWNIHLAPPTANTAVQHPQPLPTFFVTAKTVSCCFPLFQLPLYSPFPSGDSCPLGVLHQIVSVLVIRFWSAGPEKFTNLWGRLKCSARAVRAQCNYLGIWPY